MNDIEKKRKERRQNLELVMFPASKNFPPSEELDRPGGELDDPLEELMQEFAGFEEEYDGPAEAGHVFGLSERNDELLLELSPQFKYSREGYTDIIQEQIELLRETQQRLKYYLDEIDSVLPTR